MSETTLDISFRFYAVIFTVVLAVFFAFKHPTANCMLGFSACGLGGEILYGSFTFGQLAVVLQTLTLAKCLVDAVQLGRTRSIGLLLRTGISFYAFLLVLLWVKILLDCFFFGFDTYRTLSLKMAVYQTLLPSAIAFVVLAVHGTASVKNGFILGLAALSIAYVFPLAYPMLVEKRLIGALVGESRLTTYGQDTINGGRMFYFGCIGFLCAAVAMRHRFSLRSVFLAIALGFFILAVLNGTRQFLLAIVVCFVGTLLLLGRSRQLIGVTLLIGVGIAVYNLGELFTEAAVSERVGAESIRIEATSSRGAIWREVFSTALQYPVFGVGFRNYGDETLGISAEGEAVLVKDTAHGFLQDATVEHGFFVGGGLLASWLWLMVRCWRARVEEGSRLMLLLLFVLCVPEFFSGASFNSFGFHMVALTAYIMAFEGATDGLDGGGLSPNTQSDTDLDTVLSPAA